MPGYKKVGNSWSKLIPYGKVSGNWVEAKESFVKHDGIWKQYWLQNSANDSTFNVNDTVARTFNNSIESIVQQSDGKILVGGTFSLYNGISKNYIVRLNSDASIDSSFDIGTGFNGIVKYITIQSDGKILVGGQFYSYNLTPSYYIIRLNSDGSVDSSFNVGTKFNGIVNAIAIQSDGKILAGGEFTSYDGVSKNYIIRLNSDGSIDSSFDIGTGFNSVYQPVKYITIQADGKILVGGNFTSYKGVAYNRIIRLNSDGSADSSFNVGTGFNNGVNVIKIEPDGKILVGGYFTSYNGSSIGKAVRLNSNGTQDTVTPLYYISGNNINSIELASDGKILLGGYFYDPSSGDFTGGILILNVGGQTLYLNLSNKFSAGEITSMIIKQDGSIFAVGRFIAYNNISQNYISHISISGTLQSTFQPSYGFSGEVYGVAVQPDDKIIAVGSFTFYNNTTKIRIVRINKNGEIDNSFIIGTGFNNYYARCVKVALDGKILVGGQFTTYNGTTINRIVRLNSNGTIDTSFNPGNSISNNWVRDLDIQSDGKIIVVGAIYNFNGTSQNHIGRLNSDGSPDNSFNAGTGFDSPAYSIIIQPDNKILVSGGFSLYNGTLANKIIRLNSDGSIDSSFNTGTGFTNWVESIKLQPDGKILAVGAFYSYNGITANKIVRINSDGSLDTSFNTGTGFSGTVYDIDLQSDGKIIVGGNFNSYNGVSKTGLVRLNQDGSLDTTFNETNNLLTNSWINNVKILNNSKILIAGLFDKYSNKIRNSIAIIGNDFELPAPVFTSPISISSVDDKSAIVSWDSTDQSYYSINFSPSVPGQPFTGTTKKSRKITGLSELTEYTLTAEIYNGNRSISQSTLFSTTLPLQPAFTSSPTASSVTNNSATISWNSINQDSYSITFSPSVSGQPFAGTIDTSRLITGLDSSTSYTATVQIINGSKNASENVTFTTNAPGETISSVPYVAPTTNAVNITSISGGNIPDDGYFTLNLPFTTYFNGTGYNQIHIGTNSYATFGGGATDWSNFGPTVPNFPKILINAADRGSNGIYYTSDASSWTMRYEGSSSTSGTPIALIWELYCSSSNPKNMRLSISETPGGGVTGIYDASSLIESFAGGAGTSWSLVSA